MTYKGFNFRSTAGFVTDGANDSFVNSGTTYPTSLGNGYTAGWESSMPAGNDRDRNSGIDARLAGLCYIASGDVATEQVFRVDLPNTGLWRIRAAFGDAGSGNTHTFEIFDNTTSKVFVPEWQLGSNQWLDATGAERLSVSAWVNANAYLEATFASTILRVKLYRPSSLACCISHLSLEFQGGTSLPILAQASL